MYHKLISVVLFTLVVFQSSDARRTRKNKHVNTETEESTPQPSVLTYSTFGFNDVGSYDGFVPSSPDYANYLTNHHQEPSSKLYAPAFPSNLDSSFAPSYDAQISEQQMGVNNFQPAQMDFFTSPSSDYKDQNKYFGSEDMYRQITEDSPAYGAKLNSKSKSKPQVEYNSTRFSEFGNNSPVTDAEATIEKNPFAHEPQEPQQMKFDYHESSKINSDIFKHSPNSEREENESFLKMPSAVSPNPLNFPKVIDFTHLKENYPSSISNQYLENTQKTLFEPSSNENNEGYYSHDNIKVTPPYKAKNNLINDKNQRERKSPKINSNQYQDSSVNAIHIGNNVKSSTFDQEHKNKLKSRPWLYSNYVDDKKKNGMKGYQYSTNHSSTSFKYDYGSPKLQFNSSVDEIAPASSNQGFTSYQLPEKDFTESNKLIPAFKSPYDTENTNIFSFVNQNKPFEETPYDFKNTYTTLPTVSSHWGNIFKTTEYSQHKNHIWKPNVEENSEDIVHIPRRPYNQKYVDHLEENHNDWTLSNNNYRPYKLNKPQNEWSDNVKTRFKSEEDLLGLRNHETSRPNYFPSFKPSYNDFAEEFDYKKLVEKWRQNYIKSKQRDSYRDYEPYSSDHKPIHVPMPRPYAIEVPHPVIVPVPQPYPVKVPIPKPVAVPVIKEVTVPIEKPVPYPVYKKVPYPIVKPVPVPVVKQVPVPVVKPYPVAVPQIRPIFHHTKPHNDDDADSDEEYSPRPDKKPYPKKLKNTRNRPRSPAPHTSRRPSRMTYQDRNKRRLPPRPAFNSNDHRYGRRPSYNRDHYDSPPHRYRDESEEDEYEPSEFYLYCKRTGKC